MPSSHSLIIIIIYSQVNKITFHNLVLNCLLLISTLLYYCFAYSLRWYIVDTYTLYNFIVHHLHYNPCLNTRSMPTISLGKKN